MSKSSTSTPERKRTSLHSASVDSIPGLVATLTPAGAVEFVNKHVLAYCGRSLDELRQWGTSDTVHPEDLPHAIRVIGASMASGEPYEIVERIRRFDGVYRWFQVRGLPLRGDDGGIERWYVLLVDIDDLKRAEDALRASERRLTLIVDTIPALAWSADPDGTAVFLNRHYLEFIGLSAEEAYGWGWSVAVHPDDLAPVTEAWRRILASGSPGEGELRLRRHDGVYRWFLFRASPLRDERGDVVHWYGVNTDIEDRKRAELAEQALDRARSELAHVARVTTLTALTASIAHEVNQPLTGILTNAGTCVRMLDADPPNLQGARDTARRVIRDGDRAAQVMARLRALFSRKEFAPEPMDLNDAAREVVALSLGELQRNRVVLDSQLASPLPAVVGDRVQLQQVILNLLRNACDAMIGVEDRPRELRIRTESDGEGCVRLSVRDAGVGLGGDSAERLFQPFHTTKDGGMGIGLSVSRLIIERHQGRLWAEPNDGPGATFVFSVPAAAAPLAA